MAAGILHHEEIYRGKDVVAKLATPRICLAGAGAIGSNLADNLARQGVTNLFLIDMDRVETHNLGTQRFTKSDIGAYKAAAISSYLYASVSKVVEHTTQKLTEGNIKKHLKGAALVVDAFDNSESRQLIQTYARATKVPTLHVGLYENYAQVIWDELYTVPKDVAGDVCDYPLARNVIMLGVVVASEVIMRYLISGTKENFEITLKDLKVTKH